MSIELKNVTKFYDTDEGRKYILRDASIVFPSGVNIGILGKNGVGKSSLLKLIGGATYQDRGRIHSDENISWPIGFKGCLQGGLTARQNVAFVCMLMQQSRFNTKRIIDFVYEFSDLEKSFDLPIRTYSTGMKAKLGFAVSLSFDFDTYLIDEMLSVGDVAFKKKSKAALKEKIQKSRVILVSHSAKKIKDFCQKAVIMNEGKLTLIDDVKTAIEQYKKLVSNSLEDQSKSAKKEAEDDDD